LGHDPERSEHPDATRLSGGTVGDADRQAAELCSSSLRSPTASGEALSIEVEERAGALVGVPVGGFDLQRELCAIRRRRPAPDATARAFWRWLAAHTRVIRLRTILDSFPRGAQRAGNSER
jgi:hypothetical protein